MTQDDGPLHFCCLLWARPGCEDDLTAYEDRVLELLAEHGALVLERVRGGVDDGNPTEVQVYELPSRAALDAYVNDPRRTAMADERDRVVARTEFFPVQRLTPRR